MKITDSSLLKMNNLTKSLYEKYNLTEANSLSSYFPKFTINGWKEDKNYFLSILGRNDIHDKIQKMVFGNTIELNDNTFSISLVDEYGHEYVPYDVCEDFNITVDKMINFILQSKLNEMALNEMPQIKTQNNAYTSHVQAAKNILAQINNLGKNPQKDDVKHIYKLISYNLEFDVENNAKSWRANGVNTTSLCKTYSECIKAFGDLYEKVFKNTSFWDKKYYELYDLLFDLETKSGSDKTYSRKLANESYKKYNLTEAKWRYNLKCGSALRKAIEDENHKEVLQQILNAYKELLDAGLIDEDDYDRYTSDFELYLYDDFEDWEDPDDVVNYELTDLYDLCDNIGVWVPLLDSELSVNESKSKLNESRQRRNRKRKLNESSYSESLFERIVVLKNSYGEIICELDRSDDGFYHLPSSILTVPFDAGDVLEIEEVETETVNEEYGEDKYSLVGQDGNAFALMGYTARCMKECGLRDEIDEMRNRATESDYDNLIRVCDEYVQRCNDIARDGFEEALNEGWNDLSGADQTAVELALNYIKQGNMAVEEAARQACADIADGNAEPEFEDEDFYGDEPNFKNVYNYLTKGN